MEYAKRTRLPPPFVFISYIDMLISSITRRCLIKLKKYLDKNNNSQRRQLPSSTNNTEELPLIDFAIPSTTSDIDQSLLGRLLSCKPCRKITEHERDEKKCAIQNLEFGEADLYWKHKAKEYYDKTKETDEVQEKLNHIWNSMINGQKTMDVLQNSLRQINDRIFSLEKLMIKSHVQIHQEDKSLVECQKIIHVLSRESPYIYTNEARFPVAKKYISWAVPYDLYDPTLIILSKEHICFQDDERPFVESNLLKLSSTEDQSKIDTQCRNPMGRTGVRGRGALIRWGPNKSIMAIITRWKRHHDQFVIVDGQRILEAMVFKDKITNDWKLPVGNILGVESPYSALCQSFNKLAFQEDDPELILPLQEQGMIEIGEVAQEFDVQVLRLPVRYYSLNPVEIAWAGLKDYVRKNNTSCLLTNVYELASEFIAGFDDKAAQDPIRHAEKVETTYKAADEFVENTVEPQLIDDVSDIEIDNFSDASTEL
ncbi:unnamed protein product [Rotaria sordida]|uniref:Uncharacterized protein n=1 Tax=Rotaria sordida TaxID=392033 RepID=A0A819CH83_9BILA|nr:unnamed protein product [Rotaria sordida]